MRKKETPNPSRMRGRGVEVSETLFYKKTISCIKCIKHLTNIYEKHRKRHILIINYLHFTGKIL